MRHHYPHRFLLLVTLTSLPVALEAQPERLKGGIPGIEWVSLDGSVHPLARPEFDAGPADPNLSLPVIVMGLRQTPSQQQEIDQLLTDLQDLKSLRYHQFLTVDEYAQRFGFVQQDIDRITAWLAQNGFHVLSVSPGRDVILFSASVAQVQQTFRTPIHVYRVHGETHFANSAAPQIPRELADVVSSIRGLNDFLPKPPRRRARTLAKMPRMAAGARPQFLDNYGNNFMVPDDISTIYNIAPLYKGGADGTGQTIAVAGSSDISMSDIEGFRSAFNLPVNDPVKMLVPKTPNPGMNGSMGEADLDLEWAGAIAPKAQIQYVYSVDPFLSTFYAIDQNLAPVLSTSFGVCEWHMTASDYTLFHNYSQKAALLGITWVASSGDSGAAGCESQEGPWLLATTRMSVDMPASLPEVTAVGGTEFSEGNGSYYASAPGPNGGTATKYIPEVAWNDEAAMLQTSGIGILSEEGLGFSSSGGGASVYWPKPKWQTGPGVPQDGARDVPDIAFNASNMHDPYIILTGGNPQEVGGTSVSAPVFAGILALLNQYLVSVSAQSKPGLGNINPMLYSLGQNFPAVYHDVTSGSNAVPCAPGSSQDCGSSGVYGYSAGTGYDQVTGWGSADVNKLANTWATVVGSTPSLVYDVTTKQSWNNSCSQSYYQSATWFLPTDPAANIYFEVNNVGSGNKFTDQWIRPDGTIFANGSWSSGSGNMCFGDGINISGVTSVTNNPGTWHARVYMDGGLLFDLSFTISPAQLTNYMMTKSVNGCNTPTPATTFSSSDTTAYLWFNVANANAGDIPSIVWSNPSGGTYSSGSWSPVSSAGSFCFWWNLPIAGSSPAATPGKWSVAVQWNKYPLLTTTFTITNP